MKNSKPAKTPYDDYSPEGKRLIERLLGISLSGKSPSDSKYDNLLNDDSTSHEGDDDWVWNKPTKSDDEILKELIEKDQQDTIQDIIDKM